MRLLDYQGNVVDWGYVTDLYGLKPEHIAPAPAGTAFRLIEIQELRGPSVLIVKVLDQAGKPSSNWAARHWDDMTPDGNPDIVALGPETGVKTRPYPIACIHLTDPASGEYGFGLGGDWLRDGVGPDTVWIASPSHPSDVISNLGMLMGTEHHGMLRLTFQIGEGQPGSEPQDPGNEVPEARPDLVRWLRDLRDTAAHLLELLGAS